MKNGKSISEANIYHKVSNITPPFWGLTSNRLKQLNADKKDFYVRLDHLHGSVILTSQEVNQLKAKKGIAKDGDYKFTLNDF